VDPAVIEKDGEVSEQVAREMANGARRRFSSTYGIGITGIAGPTGGSEAKPVGTVHSRWRVIAGSNTPAISSAARAR
jgi:PncC family amidohydrolase